jgi:hypothetical protein
MNYLPDSIYTVCDNDCGSICSNVVWSNVLNTYVHDSQNGKVFCPFGMDDSMNQSNYSDQKFIVGLNPNNYTTQWGRVPQLPPRPLSKIGLEWRTS